jgi:hypothetical protein
MKFKTLLYSAFALSCTPCALHAQAPAPAEPLLAADAGGEKEPEELVKNSSFESVAEAGIHNWNTTAFAAVSSKEKVVTGERSIKMTSDKADFHVTATQEIKNFERGKRYRLSYQARAAKFGLEYRVYIGLWKTNPQTGEQSWVMGIDEQWRQGLDWGWQTVNTDFTTDSSADMMMVVIETKGPGTLWFDDVSVKQGVQEKAFAPLPPFVGSPQTVQIMPDRTFRVKGKPFFPIILWGWHPNTEDGMAKARDFGFNVVTPTHIDALGPDGLRVWLDAAQRYDLMVKATSYFGLADNMVDTMLPSKIAGMSKVIKIARDHPAFFAYNIADEPAWGGVSMKAYSDGAHLFRSLDPNHPILVNHAPRNGIPELKKYNAYADASGSDIYPVWKTGVDVHSDLPNKTIGVVGDETTKNLEAVDFKKPVIQTLQAFSWSDNSMDPALKDEPFPTAEQLRFMTYHSIVRGATGVSYFQDGRYPTIHAGLKPIVREMNAMSDVLAGGKTLEGVVLTKSPGIETLVKEYEGQRVYIVLNSSAQPVEATFDMASAKQAGGALAGGALKDKLTVLGEKRCVTVANDGFTDSFAPYAVHIYTTASNETKIAHPFVPSKTKAPTEAALKDAERKFLAARSKQVNAVTPKGRPNLALASNGTKVTVSSQLGLFLSSNVNDGDRWNGMWNDATGYTYPDWLTLDFPKLVTIDKIIVYSHDMQMYGVSVKDGIRDYLVQMDDNGEWKTIHTMVNSQKIPEVISLKQPVTTQKLRFVITATNGDQDWTRVQEIEVYGP